MPQAQTEPSGLTSTWKRQILSSTGTDRRYGAEHTHQDTMSLTQLIYVSTAAHELDDKEIRKILDSSIRHNTPQEVTGLLLYFDGSFMQVLEGEKVAVDETMSRIERDPLHYAITVLTDLKVPHREFGKWSMGFRGIKAPDAATWPAYAPFFEHGFNAGRIEATPGLALEILRNFAKVT